MAQQVFGKLHKIFDAQQISENFTKREFVVKTDEQYPQHILLELQHDNIYLLDDLAVGTIVTVSINLRGRSWTNPQGEEKFFNTMVAWKIEKSQSETNSPAPVIPQVVPPANSYGDPANFNEEEEDDLPF